MTVAIRGFLAIAFGITVYVWPNVTLSAIVAPWPIWLEGIVCGSWRRRLVEAHHSPR